MDPAVTQARELGLTLEFGFVKVGGIAVREGGRIVLCRLCPPASLRVALAREIGHAFWGHPIVGRTEHDELLAEMYAARLLIDADDYRWAHLLLGGNLEEIATALRVPLSLVEIRSGDFEDEPVGRGASSLDLRDRLA